MTGPPLKSVRGSLHQELEGSNPSWPTNKTKRLRHMPQLLFRMSFPGTIESNRVIRSEPAGTGQDFT